MTVFSNYAQYYDLLNQQKDYKQEIDYIISLMNQFAPKASKLIDLGCGTGLHAINLAENGYHVTGIDQSRDMINIAFERLKTMNNSISNLLNFNVGDIRTFSINKLFDVALSLFHVISYQITNNDLNLSFKTVSKHLKPGGIFIFDCWYGPAVLTNKPYKRDKFFENDKIIVNRTATPHTYPTKNQVDVIFDIKITNKTTGDTEEIKEIHKMRYLFSPEIEFFLNNNNLKLLNSEEWLTERKPSFDSWYVTFICEKI